MKTSDLKTPKKLVVKRSTLRDLTPGETQQVVGGGVCTPCVVSNRGACSTTNR